MPVDQVQVLTGELKTRVRVPVGLQSCTCYADMARQDLAPGVRPRALEVSCQGAHLTCVCSNLQLPDVGLAEIQTPAFRDAVAQAVCTELGMASRGAARFTVEAERQRGTNLLFIGVAAAVAGGGLLWWLLKDRDDMESPEGHPESLEENPYADELLISEAVTGELMPVWRSPETIDAVAKQWAREQKHPAQWPLSKTERVLGDLVRAGVALKRPTLGGTQYRSAP